MTLLQALSNGTIYVIVECNIHSRISQVSFFTVYFSEYFSEEEFYASPWYGETGDRCGIA